MGHASRLLGVTVVLGLIALPLGPVALAAGPEGQMTWAVHVTLAPRWLDPGETESAITPFLVLYAIHDALVKPMPAGQSTPSLEGPAAKRERDESVRGRVDEGVIPRM